MKGKYFSMACVVLVLAIAFFVVFTLLNVNDLLKMNERANACEEEHTIQIEVINKFLGERGMKFEVIEADAGNEYVIRSGGDWACVEWADYNRAINVARMADGIVLSSCREGLIDLNICGEYVKWFRFYWYGIDFNES